VEMLLCDVGQAVSLLYEGANEHVEQAVSLPLLPLLLGDEMRRCFALLSTTKSIGASLRSAQQIEVDYSRIIKINLLILEVSGWIFSLLIY
jgi:hypothetical protein